MSAEEMVAIIREFYAEHVKAEKEAEKEYDADRRNRKKREIHQTCFYGDLLLTELCDRLNIELYNDDFQLIVGRK